MNIFAVWSAAQPLTWEGALTSLGLVIATLMVPSLFTVAVLRVVVREVPPYSNYRGRPVMLGLGMAWLFVALVGYLGAVCLPTLPAFLQYFITVLIFPLVVVMFGVGSLDDWFGQYSQSRGFRAHLATLKNFTMSTGMLKLAVLFVMAPAVSVHLFTTCHIFWGMDYRLIHVLGGAFVIIFSAHFINLMDLRPLRAAKVYIGGATAIIGVGLALAVTVLSNMDISMVTPVGNAVILLIFTLLPPLITWRFEAREEAMLGDGGANAMGAYLGALACIFLKPSWLPWLALILFALNLIFDNISFSSLVDRSAVLTRIDMWGRKDKHGAQENSKTRQSRHRRGYRRKSDLEPTLAQQDDQPPVTALASADPESLA